MKLGKEFRGMGSYLTLGIQMVMTTAVGAAIGWYLDSKTGKQPLFLIIFFILGAFGGMAAVWRGLHDQPPPGGPKPGAE